MPQGREIFPQLTVRENLEVGFARLSRKQKFIEEEIFDLFPILKDMLSAQRAETCPADNSNNWPLAGRW